MFFPHLVYIVTKFIQVHLAKQNFLMLKNLKIINFKFYYGNYLNIVETNPNWYEYLISHFVYILYIYQILVAIYYIVTRIWSGSSLTVRLHDLQYANNTYLIMRTVWTNEFSYPHLFILFGIRKRTKHFIRANAPNRNRWIKWTCATLLFYNTITIRNKNKYILSITMITN